MGAKLFILYNSSMPDLAKLESFVRLLHEVEKIKRTARRPDEREQTSTAEHTFELAMFCWYIASVNKLDLNHEKILKYALAHDIIEAYAGDTYTFDEEAKKTKEAREKAAIDRMEEEFPEFSELTQTLHEYESRSTPEAVFVYAADKLIDPVNLSMELTQSAWKENNVSWNMLIDNKEKKIALSAPILAYWRELVKKLEAKKDFFFHS